MKEGSYTIWGKAQSVRELVTGAWVVSTASHGGIKLDRRRNAAVPRGARQEGGWYEEDCNWAVACYVHKDVAEEALKEYPEADVGSLDTEREQVTWDDFIIGALKEWQSAETLEALGIK